MGSPPRLQVSGYGWRYNALGFSKLCYGEVHFCPQMRVMQLPLSSVALCLCQWARGFVEFLFFCVNTPPNKVRLPWISHWCPRWRNGLVTLSNPKLGQACLLVEERSQNIRLNEEQWSVFSEKPSKTPPDHKRNPWAQDEGFPDPKCCNEWVSCWSSSHCFNAYYWAALRA